jgi:membrane protein YdbS with pleckstrin-like domain
MSYLDDHLLAGERIVYRARLHWTIFLTSIVVVLLGVVLWILLQALEPAYSFAGLGLAGIGLLLAIGPGIRYVTSEFAVTDKRVLGKTGLIERESDETLLSKVEAISVDQGVIGRVLGFGTVTITGTGGTQKVFSGIAEPLEFRRQVQSQIIDQEERRGSRAGTVASAPGEPRVERECPHCAERILARARVCKHCGRDVVPV